MRTFACLALAACLASPAYAQSPPAAPPLPSPEELAAKDTVTVALGAAIVPDYEGSDDYRIVPAGARHNVKCTGREPLKLYTIYGPPEHVDGTVHATKLAAGTAEEHFDGKTTE